ncbi:hypothetical protein MKS88_005359 [Plasmodium brasilianum]|uniref:Uncharacterized protein n=1 Tax=Plasmodium brasilianum TaxID=5824 RepID=A0ACB9Y0M8_PLABR|nr:hypothetical protein MKS88_005359 [Plasmodium brasilianum]
MSLGSRKNDECNLEASKENNNKNNNSNKNKNNSNNNKNNSNNNKNNSNNNKYNNDDENNKNELLHNEKNKTTFCSSDNDEMISCSLDKENSNNYENLLSYKNSNSKNEQSYNGNYPTMNNKDENNLQFKEVNPQNDNKLSYNIFEENFLKVRKDKNKNIISKEVHEDEEVIEYKEVNEEVKEEVDEEVKVNQKVQQDVNEGVKEEVNEEVKVNQKVQQDVNEGEKEEVNEEVKVNQKVQEDVNEVDEIKTVLTQNEMGKETEKEIQDEGMDQRQTEEKIKMKRETGKQVGDEDVSQQNEVNMQSQAEVLKNVVPNEEMGIMFNVYHIGINKIEAIKALYRDYKKNFNKSFKEKMNKLNSFICFYNDNNLGNHITVDYINDKDKINAIKRERLSRLFLYIEDINKLKQALKVNQQHNNMELEDDGKKEHFYDANENIDDFFIFDHPLSYLNNDVETIFTECENSSFFRDDASIDNFLEEGKNKSSEEFNMSNIFAKFSLKNYYFFDINKNLCYIYDCTPMVIKKFAEKINSYNIGKNSNKDLNSTTSDNISFPIDPQSNDNSNYYPSHPLTTSQNLETYIQFHCEKWQENMYDIVEVNSLEFDFHRLKCSIM